MSAPFQPAHTPKLEPLSAVPIKTLLCQAKIPGEHIKQCWLKPGYVLHASANLTIAIRYDRDVNDDYAAVITTRYRDRGSVTEDHPATHNTVDLRFINRIYIVLREHNLDTAGRPIETLIDIYSVPLTEALPL